MTLRPFAAMLVATSCTIGAAQHADFGLQGGLTFPSGDFTSRVGSDPSFSYGAQGRFQIRNGHALVVRFDLVDYSGSDATFSPAASVKDKLFSFGVEYNYYFSRRVGQGFYLGGGLGYIQKREQYTAPDGYYFDPGTDPSATNERIFFSFGVGYAFNKHLSTFGRFQFFGDDRTMDTYNTQTGQYQANYSLTTLVTAGLEYHF